MDFDDAEWVVAERTDADEADWVLADAGAGAISGIFYNASGRPAYAPFDPHASLAPDPALPFIPPSTTVRAASHGLLCLRGPWSTYYVCNPTTARLAALPRPPRHHPCRDPALALLFGADDRHYMLVCALDDRFDTFSSATGKWRTSAASCAAVAGIVPSSGVSSAGVAYWRADSGAVVAYDPTADAARVVWAPAGVRWELGEAGGRLCCAIVTDAAVEVHALGPSDRWELLGSVAVAEIEAEGEGWERADGSIVCFEPPWPLRFQSANLEVLLWVDGRVVALDLESRRAREIAAFSAPPPGCVSHINTLAPVFPPATPAG